MSEKKKKLGELGEDLAAEYLSNSGYKIIERNYRYGHGEIDIVAKNKDVLIFVEVKTRKSLEYGYPEMSITKSKQKQIKRMAEIYLWDREIRDTDCRMDVIAILIFPKKEPEINHIINAF